MRNWTKLDKEDDKWKQQNKILGSDGPTDVDVVVWTLDDGDLDVTLYKSRGYKISIDGSDQGTVNINNFIIHDIHQKDKAEKLLRKELEKNPDPMGILSSENKHKVWTVSVGKYHTQGMGAPGYASREAKRIAESIEEEYGIETAVGDMEGRKFRSNTKGGNYGGEIPVYASENLTEKQVRKVK